MEIAPFGKRMDVAKTVPRNDMSVAFEKTKAAGDTQRRIVFLLYPTCRANSISGMTESFRTRGTGA